MNKVKSKSYAGLALGLALIPIIAGCATTPDRIFGKSQYDASYQSNERAGLLSTSTRMSNEPQGKSRSAKVAMAPKSAIQPVSFLQEGDDTDSSEETEELRQDDSLIVCHVAAPQFEESDSLPPLNAVQAAEFPIDLPTALRLAGADNLQIAFAAEQVQQALARVDAADVLWVPSVKFGVGYNNHAGRIQSTEGNVIEAARSSLFVGGGFATGSTPIAGGASGPARMVVDLSLVDILFEPLAARQAAQAAQANQTATFNDTLLATSIAYLDLIRANSQVVVAKEAVANARELARITEDFSKSGKGLQADADRAMAELASRRRDELQAQEAVAVTSAELARILRLDPTTRLLPAETQPVSVQLVDQNMDVHSLIGQAHSMRPELSRATAVLQETCSRVRQEQLRPILPNIYTGFSGGGFGGSDGSAASSFSDRTDFDIGVTWEMQNLGFGNTARQSERQSVHRQACVSRDAIRERIATEVTQAFEQVRHRDRQISIAEEQVRSASKALQLNLDGIRGGELRPIEIQQAIGGLANARSQYFDAIIDHNRAQFALMRAIGQPPN